MLNGIFMLTETTVRFLPFPTLDPLPSPRGMDTVCLGGRGKGKGRRRDGGTLPAEKGEGREDERVIQ